MRQRAFRSALGRSLPFRSDRRASDRPAEPPQKKQSALILPRRLSAGPTKKSPATPAGQNRKAKGRILKSGHRAHGGIGRLGLATLLTTSQNHIHGAIFVHFGRRPIPRFRSSGTQCNPSDLFQRSIDDVMHRFVQQQDFHLLDRRQVPSVALRRTPRESGIFFTPTVDFHANRRSVRLSADSTTLPPDVSHP